MQDKLLLLATKTLILFTVCKKIKIFDIEELQEKEREYTRKILTLYHEISKSTAQTPLNKNLYKSIQNDIAQLGKDLNKLKAKLQYYGRRTTDTETKLKQIEKLLKYTEYAEKTQ